MANKKYSIDVSDLQTSLAGIFGTRAFAYNRLCLEAVGMDMPSFYRIWRDGKASLPEYQTLSSMLDVWWDGIPETYRGFARYDSPFTAEQLEGWRRNLATQHHTEKPTP